MTELKPTDELKVDTVKYGKLRDGDIDVFVDGQNISAVHRSSGINVQADSRDNLRDNWEIAQQALNSAIEHQESAVSTQAPRQGYL